MEAVGRLAGGIAHDFNNLLTTVIGYTEMLVADTAEGTESLNALNEILKASERAASLTRQLLAFSRRQVLRPEPLDPGKTIQDMAGMLHRLIGEDIALSVVSDPTGPLVKADKTQLEQVILNLVLNSRDAMPSGGEITIEVERVHSVDGGGPGRNQVQISVADVGHGMDESTLSQIFEPFFTTKEMGKGTGLGLSMVYGIVQQSGGEIKAWSRPGQGTRITVVFDEVQPEAPTQTEEVDRDLGVGERTILVVEDEPTVRRLVVRQLEVAGLTVISAGNGDEALRLAEEYEGEIHGMLTDVIMPGMNGVRLANEMARRREGIRILLMSGYTERVREEGGADTSGYQLLHKPFTREELIQALRDVLEVPALSTG